MIRLVENAIAERFLPAGRDLDQFKDQIQALNQVADPSTIQVGDILRVPRE